MTTRLPQEVYDELGFTHEQFEQAMAMVQELGSNRAADKAMGLSSGTVARWARAWLLASRAIEENPQADAREILAGLKLGRRAAGPASAEAPAGAGLGDPDSPEAIEALEAFRRGAGLQPGPEQQGDAAAPANLPVELRGPPAGLLEGLSARTRRSVRALPDAPMIPRSLTGQAGLPSDPGLESDDAGGGGDARKPPATGGSGTLPDGARARSDDEVLAYDAMQTMLRQIRTEALKPEFVSGLVDRVREDVQNVAALTQAGHTQSEQQAQALQERLESLAEGLRDLSEASGQPSGQPGAPGEELKLALDSASAMLRQLIEQQVSVAERIRELKQGQDQASERAEPAQLGERVGALVDQVRLLARSADLALVRDQIGGIQRLLEIGVPTVGATGGISDDFPVAQLLASIDSQLARYSANIQTRLEQVYTQTADSSAALKADLAGRHQIEMLRSELPAQFSTLNVRIEAMLNQQADEIRLQARVPAAVTERLQSQLSDLNYSIGRLLDKGQQESETVVRETKQLFAETRQWFGETRGGLEERLATMDRSVAALLDRGFVESRSLIQDTRALVETGHRLVVERTEDLSLARQQIEALQSLFGEASSMAPKSSDLEHLRDRIEGLSQQLADVDQQLAGQLQVLGRLIAEREDAGRENASQFESRLSAQLGSSVAELFSRLEALGVQSVAGSESLVVQLRVMGEQSVALFAQLESRLPASFFAQWEDHLQGLQARIATLADRGAEDVAAVLAELKAALEANRDLLVDRTE
ncbi:MAG: hypothetical protein ACKO3C_02725, partial [Betaproteobacteria bacterium]